MLLWQQKKNIENEQIIFVLYINLKLLFIRTLKTEGNSPRKLQPLYHPWYFVTLICFPFKESFEISTIIM